MHKTRNDLAAGTREKVVGLLNQNLADCLDLANQAKQAHWNVKGPNFIALHELFDKVHEVAKAAADEIAERAAALGGQAEGTTQIVGKRTRLPEFTPHLSQWREVVNQMGRRPGWIRAECPGRDRSGRKAWR
jgi:starvation-inducible DNA-binding protein